MTDSLTLNCGVTITASAGPKMLTRITWRPGPPYSDPQLQEIRQYGDPWLVSFLNGNAGPLSAPLKI